MAPGSPWWASAMALSDSAYAGAIFSPSWPEPDDPVKMLSRVGSEGKYKPLTTCQATANAPTINTTSPKVRIHRRFTNRRSEEHTSELQSRGHLVCRLLLEKNKQGTIVRMRRADGQSTE